MTPDTFLSALRLIFLLDLSAFVYDKSAYCKSEIDAITTRPCDMFLLLAIVQWEIMCQIGDRFRVKNKMFGKKVPAMLIKSTENTVHNFQHHPIDISNGLRCRYLMECMQVAK